MPVYELMRKDQRVTVLAVNKTGGIEKCDYKNINQEIAPLQERICSDWIERWWNKRAVPLNQGKIREILEQHGVSCPEAYLVKNLGLSLTDFYWIRQLESGLTWKMVSFYQNEFRGNLEIAGKRASVSNGSTLTYTPDSTLQGALEKSWSLLDHERYLLKGNRDAYSTESINEAFASQLHKMQEYDNYASYELMKIKGAKYDYGCYVKAFTSEQKELVSAYAVVTSEKQRNDCSTYEHFIQVCGKHGIDTIQLRHDLEYQIMTDFILSNVDRHFNNIGVLRDAESLKFLRMAPIFDSGKSLFVSEPIPAQEELRKIKTASFAGTELGLLKYVKDRSIVDAAKLPSAELLWQLYQKDSRMDEARAKLVCDRYEKKIELFQRWQQGQDLNPRRFYKNCRTVQIQKQKEKGFE